MGQRAVNEVGEDLLDHRVATVLGLGLGELERAVGEHSVVPVGGEELFLPLGCGFGAESLDAPHDQLPIGAVGADRKSVV